MDAAQVPGPGSNVAKRRKEQRLSQVALARKSGVSVSLLSKIEVGDRALTPGVGAAIARALNLTLDELLGSAPEENLNELNFVIRRFDIPGPPPEHPETLQQEVDDLNQLRYNSELSGILQRLPGVLSRVTNYAHFVQQPKAWTLVADVYGTVYWLRLVP
ncbi:helix-turn-helix transcriptional regulator [Streptomyces niveiscabiei]|nr:helix-turn-helix transcriptional regulator [Streptomyces niveiscabiei]